MDELTVIDRFVDDREFRKTVEKSGRDNWLRVKAAVAFDRINSLLSEL